MNGGEHWCQKMKKKAKKGWRNVDLLAVRVRAYVVEGPLVRAVMATVAWEVKDPHEEVKERTRVEDYVVVEYVVEVKQVQLVIEVRKNYYYYYY